MYPMWKPRVPTCRGADLMYLEPDAFPRIFSVIPYRVYKHVWQLALGISMDCVWVR